MSTKKTGTKKTSLKKTNVKKTGAKKTAAKKTTPVKTSVVKAKTQRRPSAAKSKAAKPAVASRREGATAKAASAKKPVKAPAGTPAKGRSGSAKAAKRAKARKTDAPVAKRSGVSPERAQVMRRTVKRKGNGRVLSASDQERVSKALESIEVVRHAESTNRRGSKTLLKSYGKQDLKAFRDMLLRIRTELTVQVQSLRSASLTRDDAVNSEEDGTDAFERQLALQLASDEGDSIFQIDEAIQRIADETYGVCQDCGCLIGKERLKALPFTPLCIACQSASEKRLHHHHARRSMT